MTSSKPRRCYLSRAVHVGLLSHGTGTFLTHRLPLRLTEPTVTQYSPFFPITTDYHLKTFTTPPSPHTRCTHPSTDTVPITVLQTHKRKYMHIAQPKNNTPPHHHYHNTPVLHVTVTSYKPPTSA